MLLDQPAHPREFIKICLQYCKHEQYLIDYIAAVIEHPEFRINDEMADLLFRTFPDVPRKKWLEIQCDYDRKILKKNHLSNSINRTIN